jgi:exosome complex component RRP43
VFSLEELGLVEGESAWTLYADIVCLDYDGSVADACLLALVAALKDGERSALRICRRAH